MKKVVSLVLAMVLMLSTLLMPTAWADSNPIKIDIKYDKTSISVGETITATYEVTGGSGVYTDVELEWCINGTGAGTGTVHTTHVTEPRGSISYTPVNGTHIYLSIDARDSMGRTEWEYGKHIPISGGDHFVIEGTKAGEPLKVTITADKEKLQPGETITFSYEVTGGTGLYTEMRIQGWTHTDVYYEVTQESGYKHASLKYTYGPYYSDSLTKASGTYSFTPNEKGLLSMNVYVKDTAGKSTSQNIKVKGVPSTIYLEDDGKASIYYDNQIPVGDFELPFDIPTAKASYVALSDYSLKMNVGDTNRLTVTVYPSNANQNVTWSSSNKKVATVVDGVVTAVGEGTAKITVKTSNGKKATCTVKVSDPYKPSKVVLDQSGTVTLNMGETLALGTALEPETAKATLTWSTSSKKVATVADGVVTPLKEGTATITVKTHNGKKDTVKVKVVDPYKPTGVVLDQSKTVTLKVGETIQLNAELAPATAQTTLTWSSSSKKVATVKDGLVTAVKKGNATITVKTANGKKDTVKIKVVPAE